MRLNWLHLCNFRQHVDTRISFEAGLTGIIGPNGSGKSTILEAIAWALYGMPAARGTRDSIRSYRASPRAAVKVDLEFELAGHRYLISRGLTSAELYLDGAAAPIATSISGVGDLVRRRVGMSHDEFFHTYFTGQKELGVMAAMAPVERAQFLSRVLGYERLRTAQELVRRRRSAIDAETRGVRAGMPDRDTVTRTVSESRKRQAAAQHRATATERDLAKARQALDAVTPTWDSVQRERDLLNAVVAELRVAENEQAARTREQERAERELGELAAARLELERLSTELQRLSALQRELGDLERACNEEARRHTLSDAVAALAAELERLAERRVKIEQAPALEAEVAVELGHARAELQDAQARFEDAQTRWVQDKQEAETKRQALVEQLRDVEQQREQIISLGEGGTCPICARPLGTHFRSVLEVLETQIEAITVDGRYYRSRIDQLAQIPADVAAQDARRRGLFDQVGKLERRLARIQAAVQELTGLVADMAAKAGRRETLQIELATITTEYDAARHHEVKLEVERLVPMARRAERLSAQLEREQQLVAEREASRSALAELDHRIATLRERRAGLAFSEEAFDAIRDRYDAAARSLRTAELDDVAASTELAAAQASLVAAEQSFTELERTEHHVAELTRDRRLHDELDRAFGDIRADLNQELRPELSDRASRYIRELTDGRYTDLELDDQYNVIVLEDAIPKHVISGGEEDLANLVLRLAISEMIAERAGQAFSLLILDEVFGSLDESRRHNVVDLLRRLQDRFEQIILITHIESVREGLDRVIGVRYDEESGSARIETDLPLAAGAIDVEAGAAD